MASTASTSYAPAHPSSTLVNISDDADSRLIRVLAPSDNASFEKECGEAIADGDAARLLRTIVGSGAVSGLLGSDVSLDEAVSVFSLLTVYLDRVGDAAVEKELCAALADAVTSASGGEEEGRREKQSAMVAALFNLRTDGSEKVGLLTKIIGLAEESALSPGDNPRGASAICDLLDVNVLKSTLKLWGGDDGIDSAELRALYAEVSKAMDRVLAKLSGDEDKTTPMKVLAATERKQAYMLLFLETYGDEVSSRPRAGKMVWLGGSFGRVGGSVCNE